MFATMAHSLRVNTKIKTVRKRKQQRKQKIYQIHVGNKRKRRNSNATIALGHRKSNFGACQLSLRSSKPGRTIFLIGKLESWNQRIESQAHLWKQRANIRKHLSFSDWSQIHANSLYHLVDQRMMTCSSRSSLVRFYLVVSISPCSRSDTYEGGGVFRDVSSNINHAYTRELWSTFSTILY